MKALDEAKFSPYYPPEKADRELAWAPETQQFFSRYKESLEPAVYEELVDKYLASEFLGKHLGVPYQEVAKNFDRYVQEFYRSPVKMTPSQVYDDAVSYYNGNFVDPFLNPESEEQPAKTRQDVYKQYGYGSRWDVPNARKRDAGDLKARELPKISAHGAIDTALMAAEGTTAQAGLLATSARQHMTRDQQVEYLDIKGRMKELGGPAFLSVGKIETPEELPDWEFLSDAEKSEFKALNERLGEISEARGAQASKAASESLLYDWSTSIGETRKRVEKWMQIDEELRSTFIGQVAHGLGQMGIYIPAMSITLVGMAVLESSLYQEAVDDYRQSGGTDPMEEMSVGLKYALPAMVLERSGLDVVMGRIWKGIPKGDALPMDQLVFRAKEVAKAMISEGGTEAIQGAILDRIASQTYDEDRSALFTQDALKRRLIEGGVGSLVGGIARTGGMIVTPSGSEVFAKSDWEYANKTLSDEWVNDHSYDKEMADLFNEAKKGDEEARLAYNTKAISRISAEVDYGSSAVLKLDFPALSELPIEDQKIVTEDVMKKAVPGVEKILNLEGKIEGLEIGMGYTPWGNNPSAHFWFNGTNLEAQNLTDALAYVSEQEGTIRATMGEGPGQALIIRKSDATEFTAEEVARMKEADSRIKDAPLSDHAEAGKPGLISFTDEGNLDDLERAIEEYAEKENLNLYLDKHSANVVFTGNNWKENPNGEDYQKNLYSRGVSEEIWKSLTDYRRRGYRAALRGAIKAIPSGKEAFSRQTGPRYRGAIRYSKTEGRGTIDPSFSGGLQGAELKRQKAFPELYVDRAYIGLEGYQKEAGLGDVEYNFRIDERVLYDYYNDPDGLYQAAVKQAKERFGVAVPDAIYSIYESLIKDAGYLGYWTQNEAAAIFHTIPTGQDISLEWWQDQQGGALPAEKAEPPPLSSPAASDEVPVSTTKETSFPPAPEGVTALRKGDIADLREAMGLEEIPKQAPQRDLEVLAQVKAEGLDNESDLLAAEVLINPRPLDHKQIMAMVLRATKLKKAFEEKEIEASQHYAMGDIKLGDLASSQADLIRDQIDTLTRGSRMASAESGRSLRAWQFAIDKNDYTLHNLYAKARVAKKEQLTQKEKNQIKSLVDQIKEQEKSIQKLESYIKGQAALIAEHKAKAVVSEYKSIVGKRKKELARKERADLKKQLVKLGYRVNDITGSVGLSIEAGYLISRIAITHIEEGAATLEEVLERVKKDLPGVNDQDVLLALGGRLKRHREQVATEAQKRIRELKSQARIESKINDALKGKFDPIVKHAPASRRLRELRKQFNELYKKTYKTVKDDTRLKILQDKIGEIQWMLETGERKAKKGKEPDRADIAEIRKEYRELMRLMNAEDAIKDLEEQLRTGEFKISPPRQFEVSNEDLQRALVKKHQLQREVRDHIRAMQKQSLGRKAFNLIAESRTVKATADMSYLLRQGVVLAPSHPYIATRSAFLAWQSFWSENTADEILVAMKSHPNQFLRERAGLYLAALDEGVTANEELFAGRLVKNFPLFGRLVKASERHMVVGLNALRAGVFDDFIRRHPETTIEQQKAFAQFVNIASGRGDISKLGRAGEALGVIFFAPRFAVSRVQLPFQYLKNRNDPILAKEIGKTIGNFMIFGFTVLGLLTLAGVDVEWDPEESDFLKIRWGNTRIDIWGGSLQFWRVVLAPILAAGDAWGLWELENDVDPYSRLGYWLKYKGSPGIHVPISIATKKDVLGRDQSVPETLLRAYTPIIMESAVETYIDSQDISKVLATSSMEMIGISVNTYDTKKK